MEDKDILRIKIEMKMMDGRGKPIKKTGFGISATGRMLNEYKPGVREMFAMFGKEISDFLYEKFDELHGVENGNDREVKGKRARDSV